MSKFAFIPLARTELTPRAARALLALSLQGWQVPFQRGQHPRNLAGLTPSQWCRALAELRQKLVLPPALAQGFLLLPREHVVRAIAHFRSLRRSRPFLLELLSALG